MCAESRNLHQRNLFHFSLHYLICLCLCLAFAKDYPLFSSALQGLWMVLAFFVYPALYLLPGLLLSAVPLAAWGLKGRNAAVAIGVVWTFLCEFLLFLDAVLIAMYGHHINGLVINLMMTPGGFEAMGLSAATLVPAIAVAGLYEAGNVSAAWVIWKSVRLGRMASSLFGKVKTFALAASGGLAVAVTALLLISGIADFYSQKDVLSATNCFPMTFTMRMRTFMRRLGCEEPPREKALFDEEKEETSILNYPAAQIVRAARHEIYNFIWLTAESLRADMLDPEIMPNAWKVAEKGLLAADHYSGGHGTRPAMFSMFYGLHGNNWSPFLNARRAPLFFDWLQEDGYDFLVQTSAKFTYPEFDQTVFASISSADMTELKGKQTWKRDEQAMDRLIEFIKAHQDGQTPFFAFEFFEGTHAPYQFDASHALRPDYMADINYATVSAKDAQALKNRQINAANCMDRQIGRLIEALSTCPKVAERTILVICGDHGEEFYEKGRLGHNSTFVQEQIRTPLVMYIPGQEHQVIGHPTHHTDIIPTLAPFMGVQNRAEDFSVGQNMLAKDYHRSFFIVCGWQLETFVCQDGKYIIPAGAGRKYYLKNLFSLDDQPLQDEHEFLQRHARELFQANEEMNRFVKKGK